MLEAEGVQIYTNAYRGQVCFFLRKKASNQAAQEQPQSNVVTAVTTSPNSTPKTNVGSGEPTSSQPTPQPSQPQNVEDAVAQLVEQGLGFKEIQQRLGLTSGRLMGVFSSLSRKGVLQKLGWVPERRKRKPSTREAKVEPTEPSPNTSILPLREMLEASLMLLDSHPKVVRFLLEKCLEALT
jgi:hypothetical protein